ncbi:hypothetical protein CANARDRAFT_202841 [[Candida] arabinofermentans NRRL YB-2248]|uniref:Transmembrane protein n=1 Tax=[Candida] arabinofermentans NRRL YB-2248 TaxID=983967 RepID=A0A1E4SW03_9ASCO|nr:hypothetical protein CANARDRAFT_202841 [[Candida] arabinofermentans NRRL YB-2248]
MLLIYIISSFFISVVTCKSIDSYPVSNLDNSKYKPYKKNDNLQLECISRHIDNGEHQFDNNGNIIYLPFPKCQESSKSLEFQYGVDDSFKQCTFKINDELYHLFQLYLHQDSPFTCRLKYAMNLNLNDGLNDDSDDVYIPLNLNLRGTVQESHFDLDPFINVLIVKSNGFIISGVGFSSSLNSTKVIIGDLITLNFNIRWIEVESTVNDNTLLFALPKLSINKSIYIFTLICVTFIGVVLGITLSYYRVVKRVQIQIGDIIKDD